MAIWIKPTETDLAANLSLSEIDAFRRDGSLDGSDPVPALIERTVSFVRVSIASGGRCAKMGPGATIPPGLVIPAMDYTMGKVLNRIGVPLSEDRRAALRRAEELFDKIASGHMAIEDYTESEDIPQGAMVASAPVAAPPTPQRLLDSILLACSLFTITSSLIAAPLQWDCNFPEARAQTFQIYQGETVEFAPTFQINGSPATNISIEAVWIQTNGMQAAWWKLDNATFHPSNDVGAAAYRFFVEAHTPADSKIYRANGTLRMLPSPGFTPAEIPWPVRRLDFDAVEIANAPWPEEISSATTAVFSAAKSYTDSAIAQAGSVTPEMVTNIVVDVAPAPGNYAAVSNAAMSAIQSYIYPNTVDLENLKARWLQSTPWGNMEVVDKFSLWLQARKEDWKNEVLAQVPDTSLAPATNYTDAVVAGLSSAIDQNTADISSLENNVATNAAKILEIKNESDLVYRLYTGSNVVVTVTNYNSATRAPVMSISYLASPDDTSYTPVWNETNGLGRVERAASNYTDSAVAALRSESNAAYAPKAWGEVSSSGVEAPEGLTVLSNPITVFSDGYEWVKTVTASGSQWFLASSGVHLIGGTPGVDILEISALDGTSVLRVEKSDAQLVGVDATGISVSGSSVTIAFTNLVSSAGHPIIYACTNIVERAWESSDEDSSSSAISGISFSWSFSGYWRCNISVDDAPNRFFMFQYLQEGYTRIVNTAPISAQGGILATNTASGGFVKIRPKYNGSTIIWEVVP